jgi:uncharacterized repeat protein (TIGR02059 family)
MSSNTTSYQWLAGSPKANNPSTRVQGYGYVSGDDYYELYLNGEFIGKDNGDSWATAERWLLNADVGTNTIVIKVFNNANGTHPGAVIADFNISGTKIATSSNWYVSTSVNKDEALNSTFNPDQWQFATEYGDIYSPTWWNRAEGDTSGISNESSGFPDPSDAKWVYSNGFLTDSDVYLRIDFEIDGANTNKSQWLSYSGQPTDERSGGIATFSNGDIATAFSVSKGNGSSSVIVQRLSNSGTVVWSLDIDADHAPTPGSVLVGKDDNVYIVGGTKKGAAGESGKNDSDVYAAAISGTGQRIWYKNYGIGIHEIGSQAVLDADNNIILIGRVSEVNDSYSFIKDVPNFYGAEFSGGWRGFQLKINPMDGSVDKAYTTGSFNSGGELIAVDQSRNIVFVGGYTFGAVNGVGIVGNGDPAGANKYLIARDETSGSILWTRMENWVRSNIAVQEEEDAIYFVDKGVLEKVKGSTGETIWTKSISNADYVLSSIAGGGILLSESESSGNLTIRRFDSSGTETGTQVISHTGKLYPRSFIEKGDGIIQISGSTTGTIAVSASTTVTTERQSGSDSFVLQVASAFSSAPTVNGPLIRGNSLYTIVDGPSWSQAELNAQAIGGSLSEISDQSENIFLQSSQLVSGVDASLGVWIGLTRENGHFADGKTYGDWLWTSGNLYGSGNEVVGWNQDFFASGDGMGKEAVHMYTDQTLLSSWNDVPLEWYSLGELDSGIAEIPFIRRGDSAYVIVEGPTWEEAEANAVKLGGHLVTINDAEENDFLIKNNFKGWIGLTDKRVEGQWEWSSGQLFTLDDWIKPIFNRDNAHPLGQDYVYMDNDHEGIIQWDSVHQSQVQARGIAEIKLAPNNAPTGTPTLSGNLKVGSTITIDASGIQDADNHEYWTPVYQYCWEVSADGGIWTRLTSADATDNDENYTLTSAEVGKQVRGVVSYLDGYGTQESVASGGSPVAAVASQLPTVPNSIHGNSLYTLLAPVGDFDAREQKASSLGGYQLSLNSQHEQDFIFSTYGELTHEIWLGTTDRVVEGVWRNSDGTTATYSNWQPGEPNNWQNEDYAVMITRSQFNSWERGWSRGKWLDAGNGSWTAFGLTNDGKYSSIALAEIPLTSSISFSTTPREGAGLFTTSIYLTAGTESSGNLAEGLEVFWEIKGIDEEDLDLGYLSGSGFISGGKLDIQHSLVEDADAGEKLEISVFSDAERTQRIGITYSVEIQESLPRQGGESGDNDIADTDPPTLSSAFVSGNTLMMEFDEVINPIAVNSNRFNIQVDGKRVGVSKVTIEPDNTTASLTLASAVESGSKILLSYTDPKGNQARGVIEDLSGNDLQSIRNFEVTNNTPDIDPPTLTSAFVSGNTLMMEFDEIINPIAVNSNRFNIQVDGKRVGVSKVTIEPDNTNATLILATPVGIGSNVFLNYSDPNGNQSTGVIEDLFGNDFATLRNFYVDVIA